MKKPYVICHMMASIDGRIDCAMTEQIEGNSYYETLELLNTDATIEGKDYRSDALRRKGSLRQRWFACRG